MPRPEVLNAKLKVEMSGKIARLVLSRIIVSMSESPAAANTNKRAALRRFDNGSAAKRFGRNKEIEIVIAELRQ